MITLANGASIEIRALAENIAAIRGPEPTHAVIHPVTYELFFGRRPRNPKWNGRRWVKAKRNRMSARSRRKK